MASPERRTIAAPSPDQPVPDEFDLVCEQCGYSLVGLSHSNRCPECGLTFDPAELPLARVPWLFRKRMGRFATYRATVIGIILKPSAFARELCRPVRVCVEDARQFRTAGIWVAVCTAIIAAIFSAAVTLPWRAIIATSGNWTYREIGDLVAACLIVPLGIAVVYLFFRLATDLPTFIWRGLESRPIDLAPVHHYASAPLALLPLAIIPMGVWYVAMNAMVFTDPLWTFTAAALLNGSIVAVMVLLWIIPLKLMRAATGCGMGRVIALAIYLPVHWVLMFVMCALGFLTIAGLIVSTVHFVI